MTRLAMKISLTVLLISDLSYAQVNALSCVWKGISPTAERDQRKFGEPLKPPNEDLPKAQLQRPDVKVPLMINSGHTFQVHKTGDSAVQGFFGSIKDIEGSLVEKLSENCHDAIDNCGQFFNQGLKCELLLKTVDCQGVRLILGNDGQVKSEAENLGQLCNVLKGKGLEWIKAFSKELKPETAGHTIPKVKPKSKPNAKPPAVR